MGFEMIDLHTFLEAYGKQVHSNMMYFVRDMFNYVPADSPKKALKTIADANTQWKIYADYVKPTGKIE